MERKWRMKWELCSCLIELVPVDMDCYEFSRGPTSSTKGFDHDGIGYSIRVVVDCTLNRVGRASEAQFRSVYSLTVRMA